MACDLGIYVAQNGVTYDITQLVEQITWKGRKGASSRSLTVSLLDDSGYKHARSEINVEEGHWCSFYYRGVELFQGIIMSQTQNNKKRMQFTAYDNGIYLANNKDTFTYENKTASEIFVDCCSRFGLPIGEVAACDYQIPELTKSKTTAFDTITDALSLDYKASGVRHYVTCKNGRLNLITRRDNFLQWIIEVGHNILNYTFSRSIEKIKTRVKVYSKAGTVVSERVNEELENKINIFQEIVEADDDFTLPQIDELIDGVMSEHGTPERTLSIDALGIPTVTSGIGVYIIIPELGIRQTYYVDDDSHTFKNNKHTMKLKLNYANDL